LQIKTKIVSCHTADAKPVKQEVNSTVILPPLVFPGQSFARYKKYFNFKRIKITFLTKSKKSFRLFDTKKHQCGKQFGFKGK
jgi:hypothetical protein